MGRIFEVRKEAMKKTNLRKSKLYARYGKEIYMTAKQGGANPESNLTLKHLIERAKKEEVPGDVIERNIKKATSADATDFEPIRYEGFGPGGSAFLVDTLTDNVNRTVSEVRHCFTKASSKLGVKGSVEHLFNHISMLEVRDVSEDDLLETLLESNVEVKDIEPTEQGFLVLADGYDLDKIEAIFREQNIVIDDSKSGWFAENMLTLDGEVLEAFNGLLDMLNELDDVQNVYHNVDESVLNDEKD